MVERAPRLGRGADRDPDQLPPLLRKASTKHQGTGRDAKVGRAFAAPSNVSPASRGRPSPKAGAAEGLLAYKSPVRVRVGAQAPSQTPPLLSFLPPDEISTENHIWSIKFRSVQTPSPKRKLTPYHHFKT